MNYFSNFHPITVFCYFIAAIGLNIFVFDPVLFAIFLVSQSLFYLYLKGIQDGIRFVSGCFALIPICAGVNGLVNHRGVSVLFFFWGLPVTKETILYGGITGLLLSSSLILFGCLSHIMTSEKIMCLFARHLPGFSLVFSMALRLVPKIKRDFRQLRMHHGMQPGIVSALIGIALEDSMDTGVSMEYRGYGRGNRTSIYRRKIKVRDIFLLGMMAVILLSGICLYIVSETGIEVFPYTEYIIDIRGIAAYVAFGLFLNLPMIINAKEEIRWKRIVSRI